MLVYLGKDGRIMAVSRPFYADIDSEYFPRAYVTTSLPGRPLSSGYLSFRYNGGNYYPTGKDFPRLVEVNLKRFFKGYPHWGIQIGNKEIHINGQDLANEKFAKEGTVIIGDHYDIARKTMAKRHQGSEKQTDKIAKAYWNWPRTKSRHICKTEKSDKEIWEDVEQAIKYFFRRQFDLASHNCYTLAVDIAQRVCGEETAFMGCSVFNTIIGPCLSPVMGQCENSGERLSQARQRAQAAKDPEF